MPQPKPKRKPRKRKPPKPKGLPVTEEHLHSLTKTLARLAAEYPDSTLQLDDLDNAGACVIRRSEGDRQWMKVADGRWSRAHVDALEEAGYLTVPVRAKLGVSIEPTDKLRAAA